LELIKLRGTIIGILIGYDPLLMSTDLGVRRSKVNVTVTWIIKSLINKLKAYRLRDTIVGVLVGHDP